MRFTVVPFPLTFTEVDILLFFQLMFYQSLFHLSQTLVMDIRATLVARELQEEQLYICILLGCTSLFVVGEDFF